jgi:hypothetical protein
MIFRWYYIRQTCPVEFEVLDRRVSHLSVNPVPNRYDYPMSLALRLSIIPYPGYKIR